MKYLYGVNDVLKMNASTNVDEEGKEEDREQSLHQRCATMQRLHTIVRKKIRIYHSGDKVIIIDETSESGNYQLARFRFNEVQFTLSESPPKKSVNYDEHLHPFD